MLLSVMPCPSSALICPYCRSNIEYDDGVACRECSALAHLECLAVHGSCPILGCDGRRRLTVSEGICARKLLNDPRAPGQMAFIVSSLSLGLLGWRVIPAFAQMYEEVGIPLPELTQVILKVCGWSSGLGSLLLAGVVIALATVFVSVFPRSGRVTYGFTSLINLFIVPAILFVALFSPMIGLSNKL